jgi:hypothetical protein
MLAATPTGYVRAVNSESDSLNDAVRSSFPEEHCRLLALREHGDFAVALFDTRPAGEPYLYEVHYERRNHRWSESSSSNGSGWHLLHLESNLGVVTGWGEAPDDADKVRAELGGTSAEENVANGIYLFVWWDVPSEPLAELTAFHIDGQWVPAPSVSMPFKGWDV